MNIYLTEMNTQMSKYYDDIVKKCYEKALVETNKKSENVKRSVKTIDNVKGEMPVFKFSNRYQLIHGKYTVKQLLEYTKEHNVLVTGKKTKDVLRCKLYGYLHLTKYSIIIQQMVRGNMVRRYFKLRRGYSCREKCLNDTDFATMDSLSEISDDDFFSYVEKDGSRYGFHINSFMDLVLKHGNNENPYTRCKFSDILVKDIRFIKIELLGHYADAYWILNMNRQTMIDYLIELGDIWNYRLGLSTQLKMSVCPPNGSPFGDHRINLHVQNYTNSQIRHYIFSIIDKLINSGISENEQKLGAYYVLGALTIVCKDAALAMPWLFDAFYYPNNTNIIHL